MKPLIKSSLIIKKKKKFQVSQLAEIGGISSQTFIKYINTTQPSLEAWILLTDGEMRPEELEDKTAHALQCDLTLCQTNQ